MQIIKDKDSCEQYAMISIREGRKAAREYFDTILEKNGFSNFDMNTASWLA